MKNLIAAGALEPSPETCPRGREPNARRQPAARDDFDVERDLRTIMKQARRSERRLAVAARGRIT